MLKSDAQFGRITIFAIVLTRFVHTIVQAADSSHGDQTHRHFKTKRDDDIASAKRNHFVLKQGLSPRITRRH